jgi:DNA-3-methyladenine glycosylase II
VPKAPALPFADVGPKLARLDPRLAPLIVHVGPCTLQPHPHAFRILASSIVSQQISTRAAQVISGRVRALCGRGGIRPERLAELSDEDLRGAGLSTSKLLSMRSLTDFFLENRSLVRRLRTMPDGEVIDALLPIRGVGVWTAQMFLIFCLGRPDVLPTADYGFQAGVRDVLRLTELPKAAALQELADVWRPYRTVATWYFWRSRGFVPQSE